MRFNASRRNVLAAGLGLLAVTVAGCTKAVQARTAPTAGSAIPPLAAIPPTPVSNAAAPRTTSPSTASATSASPVTAGSSAPHSPVSVPRPSKSPVTTSATRAAGPARQVAQGPVDRPRVALTFHGFGDVSYARQIMQIAKSKNARITVMAVGTWLADNPEIGREILAGGHDLGNHTLSHLDINSLPQDQMRTEVVGCRDILQRTTGTPGSYFRQSQSPTANSALLAIAGQAGYRTCLSYNVDSLDFTDPGAHAIRVNVAAAGPGAIVSMHLGHSGTVTALPFILDDLKRRGLAAVTVTKLLSA
jgi:peptidoglycan/xylan/chitin deacetylase (PgdA/CDA1 family)